MWTTENRHRYDRDKLRYPSDLTDAEWEHIEPLIPPAKRGGGKRTVNMREVVNGVMYVLSTGCQWRYIPKDLPPRSTVNGYFCLWGWDGTLEKMHHALYVKCREQAEREASPTACIIDSQSVKSAEKGGRRIDPHGFDAGKLIKGKKRHVLVDTLGLLLHALVMPPTFRIATAACCCCPPCSDSSRSCASCSPTAPIRAAFQARAATASCRSCRVEIVKRCDRPKALSSNPNAGSSSAPSAGSIAVVGSPRIGKTATTTRSPSSASPPSASCSESSVIPHEVSGRTLDRWG